MSCDSLYVPVARDQSLSQISDRYVPTSHVGIRDTFAPAFYILLHFFSETLWV